MRSRVDPTAFYAHGFVGDSTPIPAGADYTPLACTFSAGNTGASPGMGGEISCVRQSGTAQIGGSRHYILSGFVTVQNLADSWLKPVTLTRKNNSHKATYGRFRRPRPKPVSPTMLLFLIPGCVWFERLR